MCCQQILQGTASNLMDSNLFQLKSSTLWKTYRWMLVTWGFLPRHFQPSVGLVFWEYQMSSLIWVIGHLPSKSQTSKMPKAKYMQLNISLNEARVKADLLQTQMFQKVCTITPSEFQAILDELKQVLAYIRYKDNLFKSWKKKQIGLCPSLQQQT